MAISATGNALINVKLLTWETPHAIKALGFVINARMAILVIAAKRLVPRIVLEGVISSLEYAISAKWGSLARTALKIALRIVYMVNAISNWVIARVVVQAHILVSFAIRALVPIKLNMTPLSLFQSFLGFCLLYQLLAGPLMSTAQRSRVGIIKSRLMILTDF